MPPARQRREARNRTVLEANDRLVQDGDLLALERPPQIGLECHAVALTGSHRGFKHLDAVAANAFGVIHRKLRILEDLLGAARLTGVERDPD